MSIGDLFYLGAIIIAAFLGLKIGCYLWDRANKEGKAKAIRREEETGT